LPIRPDRSDIRAAESAGKGAADSWRRFAGCGETVASPRRLKCERRPRRTRKMEAPPDAEPLTEKVPARNWRKMRYRGFNLPFDWNIQKRVAA